MRGAEPSAVEHKILSQGLKSKPWNLKTLTWREPLSQYSMIIQFSTSASALEALLAERVLVLEVTSEVSPLAESLFVPRDRHVSSP